MENRTSSILLVALVSAASQSPAQQAPVFSTGFQNPSKLILTPAGNLLVTDASSTPNSGRVSFVDKSGNRHTLIDGLPSGLSAPNLDVDGPNGLAMSGNVLYIEIGEGDSFRPGTAANTIVPNPAGPSSPIFASILKLTLPQSVDTFNGNFSLTMAGQSTLNDGNPLTLSDTAGDTATLEMLSFFRMGIADPVSVWRNSHPYAMTLHPSYPDALFVTDAGMNSIVQVSLSTGKARTLAHLAPFPNHLPGPPVSEAVPDGIHPYGSMLLVSLLSGAPFTPGVSEVVTVDPASGAVAPFIAGLSSAIDTLDVPRTGPRDLFFTLEYSTSLATGAPGRATRYDSAQGQVIATGLNGPAGMAYDAASGNLYIIVRGDGTIATISGQ